MIQESSTREFLTRLKEKNYSPETIKHYRRLFAYFTGGFNRKSVIGYQHHIRRLQPITRLNYLAKLRKYLKEYYPLLACEIITPKVPEVLPKKIPDQETVRNIMQQPDIGSFSGIRDRVILELFYSTGIRRKELVNLKVDDIDFSKQIIRINQGKNRKDRLLPISRLCLSWLRKYLEKVRPCLNPKSSWILLSRDGLQMSSSTPYKILKHYATYSCHKYRHAFATHLLQNGMKETSLQRLLGHSMICTTQVYTRVTGKELQTEYRRYHQRDGWK